MKCLYGIEYRIPNIINIEIKFLIKGFFKRQDDKHPVNVGLQLPGAGRVPCPDFGRDIIEDLQAILLPKFGYPAVKATVVDQNNHIRLEGENIFFTKFDLLINRPGISH